MSNDSTGRLIRYLLHHMKSIEYRLDWSTALNDFRGSDKHTISKAVNKTNVAIREVINIIPHGPTTTMIYDNLDNVTQMGNFMAFTEMMLDMKEEDFSEIVDLVETYIKNKYHKQFEISS